MLVPLRLDRSWLITLALCGLTLGVYIANLPPSITWQHAASDGAELAAAIETMGVPHPPGYPTYVLLGKLFSFLPWGDLAYRLSLLSAIAGAATVAITYRAARVLLRMVAPQPGAALEGQPPIVKTIGMELAAVTGALTLAFAPIFWGQATVTEVYALNALFVGSITLLLLSWLETAQRPGGSACWGKPVAAAGIFGLAMGNHFTVAGVAVPLAAAVLWRARGKAAIPWAGMFLAFLTGLAVYIYLPVSAAQDPPINWGDPSSLSGFWWEVSGKPYRGYVYGLDADLWDNRLGDWARQMLDQFQGVGVVLGLAGFWRLWRWDRALTSALAVAFLWLGSYAVFYNAGDSFVFLIPAIMVGALAAGAGVYWAVCELAVPALARSGNARRAVAGMAGLALVLVALAPGLSLARNYDEHDLSGDVAARDYGPTVLRLVEPDAVVVAGGDLEIFALWYYQYVVNKTAPFTVVARNLIQAQWYVDILERERPGLLPVMTGGTFRKRLQELVAALLAEGRPVYTTSPDALLQERFILAPHGVLFRVAPLPQA